MAPGLLQWMDHPSGVAPQAWSYDDPSTYRQADLDPAYARQLVSMYGDAARGQNLGGQTLDGYYVNGAPYLNGATEGQDARWMTDEPQTIRRAVGDGSYYYDTWSPEGQYLGRQGDESGFVKFREGMKFPAAVAALMYGGGYLFGDGGATAGAAAGAAEGGAMAAPTTTALGADALSVSLPSLAETGLGTIPSTMTAGEAAALGGTAAAGGGTGGSAELYGAKGYGPGMTGAQTSTFDAVAGLTGSNQLAAGASDLAGLINGGSMDLTDLAKLAGAIYGAQQSKDRTQTTTQTRDPWAPAQPYLLAQLGNVAKLQQHYQANPVNDLQTGAANQKIGLLSTLNSQVLPGLLSGMGTLSAGYQRPGGPAPRPSGMNYDPSALLAGMQGNNIDWSRMFPPKG